jgi:hypothetical protein
MLVALLALMVATGGTSYAAVKITSKDIKDHTITVKDLSPKTVKKLRGQRGPQGPPGTNGTNGADGADGRDATDVLESGKTITGSVFYRITAGVAGEEMYQSIPLPAHAPAPMTSAGFAPDAVPATSGHDPTCTGTWEVPTAPAGRLCGYYKTGSNLSDAYLATTSPGKNESFTVALTPTAAGLILVSLRWAYTAP